MAIYQILKIGDYALKIKAKEVTKFDQRIEKLINNMIDTMIYFKGVGLAATQIGVNKRIIVVRDNDSFIEFINPKIIFAEKKELYEEGCLSIPGIIGKVERFSKITVEGKNKYGDLVRINSEGFLSCVLQHEIDHLSGILFVEKTEKVRRIL